MEAKKGSLSISSENIFPIIKKWVYSDHDIFVRELVSNGCDAITKLKKLEVMGEYTFADDYKPAVQVVVDSDAKTLKFIDNGIGMTKDTVKNNYWNFRRNIYWFGHGWRLCINLIFNIIFNLLLIILN